MRLGLLVVLGGGILSGCGAAPGARVSDATVEATEDGMNIETAIKPARGVNAAAHTSSPSAAATPSPDASFWSWFVAHQEGFAKLQTAEGPLADQLSRKLHAVDPELTFELGVNARSHVLIVSADGKRSAFPAVKRLVAAAPSIPAWTIVAFRPRKEIGGSAVVMGDGTRLSPGDMSFRPIRTKGGTIDVVFYMKGLVLPASTQVKQAFFILLDSTLGEYDVEIHVAGIDLQPSTAALADARPLSDLPKVVDALK